MATEKDFSKALQDHTKQDATAFESIHDHLDRLDRATNNDLVVYKIDQLKIQFEVLDKKIDNNFVTKTEFDPVKRLVYGVVAVMLTSVVGAILAMVVRTK